MTQFGCALKMNKDEAHKMIEEAVSNASNLAEAMECVGAMYGIPSTNILVDDDLRTVKIMNDTILCPSNVGASGNMNVIAKSIAAVLDQISNRINHKIDRIQAKNIEEGKESDEVASRSDPSKGKVVATYKDSNGDILIVYDSGIIDAPQTPEGRKKADEIRSAGNVPTFDPLKKHSPSYFTDEDDLMAGVDDTSSENPIEEYCISSIINESAYFIDAMARFGDTSSLGQAILTYHGYDCVRPTMNIVQEADDDTKKKDKKDPAMDVKFMKFDNSEIHKAIECFNKARANQKEIKHVEDIDVESFIRDKDYQEAIKHLENQFDCKLSIKWVRATKPESEAHTIIYPTEYRTKLTISKSKGFQLGGAPINIVIIEDGITGLITNKQDLFGQAFTSVILHEIFHNISGIMRYENAQFITSMTVALEEASATRDSKMRRIIIDRYVDTLNAQLDGKLGRPVKRLITKRLLTLVAANSDTKLMTQIQDSLDKDSEENNTNREANARVKRTIGMYKASIKAMERPAKRAKARGIVGMIVGGISIIAGVLGIIFLHSSLGVILSAALGLGGLGVISVGITGFASVGKYNKLMKKYKNTKNLEEYYADLMSGMYQLPQSFFVGGHLGNGKKYTFNELNQSTIDEWVKVEKILYEHLEAPHPSMSERTWTGVTIAKKLLECEHLDPSVKKYLQWIVDNNDKILKSNIKEDYNSHTFDPKEAEDLDKHLYDLIKSNHVTVTESAIHDLIDSSEVQAWVENGCPYTEDEVLYQELCMFINECDSIIQETKITGYSDESFIKRFLMIIPRLIKKCIESISHIATNAFKNYVDAIYKVLTPDKMYEINIDIRHMRDSLEGTEDHMKEIHRYLSKAKGLEDYIKKIGELGTIKNTTNDSIVSHAWDKIGTFKTTGKSFESDAKIVISGKQLADCIRSIHKSGERMLPILKELLEQIDRIKKNDKAFSSLTEHEKKNFEKMMGIFKYCYLSYNDIERWIIKFRRKAMSDEDIEKHISYDTVFSRRKEDE